MERTCERAYRPSGFGPEQVDEVVEQERQEAKEALILQYARRAQQRLPLFEELPARKTA